jgi:hypothetical protein
VIRLTPERRPAPGAAGGSAGLTSNAAPVPTMRTAAARTVSPLRVALVDPGDFTPPYDAALARGLAAAGAEVRLIGQSGGDDSEAPGCHEDWFYRYSGRARSRGLPETAARLLKGLEHGIDMHRLTRALRLAAIDIVHFQWLPLPLLDHLYIMRIGAFAPTVVTMHDSLPYNGAGSVVMRLGHERSLHAADALIVHTEEARARLLANGHDAERVHVVPHGLLQPAARSALDSPSPARVPPVADRPLQLLQFGKLKPYKGIDVLLEAVGRLPQDCRARIRVLIVGKPYMPIEPLRDLIERYGLESVSSSASTSCPRQRCRRCSAPPMPRFAPIARSMPAGSPWRRWPRACRSSRPGSGCSGNYSRTARLPSSCHRASPPRLPRPWPD